MTSPGGARLQTREIDAVATALSAWIATSIAFALHFDEAWWAAISVWMVMNNPAREAVLLKGFLRVAGTIVGAVVGYAIAVRIEGIVALQMLVLGAAVTLACYQRHHARYAYAWFIGLMLVAMLVAQSLQEPQTVIEFAYWRVYEIVAGVAVVTVVTLCLKPAHRASGSVEPAPAEVDERQLVFASLFAGSVAILIVALWQVYSIPSVFQVLVTIMAVQFPDLAQTRRMALDRLAGCALGGACGLATVWLASEAYALWSLTFVLGLFVFSFIHHGGSRTVPPYIGTQAGMAFIIAMVTGSGPPDTIMPVLDRLSGIFAAFVIIGVLAYVVEPWLRRPGRATSS